MQKKIIQDIYLVKKSIRMIKRDDVRDDIKINNRKTSKVENINTDQVDNFSGGGVGYDNIENGKTIDQKRYVTKNSLIFLWIICIISIATLLFFLSSIFATATLTITPKNQIITFNDTYNIVSDKNISGLHYQVMTIKKDLSKALATDEEEYVEKKAIGKAVLYNNFSTSKQRLIINTRLETKNGLIYKTRQSVEIPGIKTVNGVKTPGSIEVEIIADDVGDKYNMNLSDFKGDFTIYGFKGTPKYSLFYGRLSANVVGGFVGKIKKVSDEKLVADREELKNTLKGDLIKEVFSKKPEQYVLFKDNYYTQCNDLADDSTSDKYKISEECSINAILFNNEELLSFVAKNKIKNFDDSKIDIVWKDNFSVSLLGNTEKPWNETSLKAKFVGPAQVIWLYDANEILNSILAQDKSVINSVIENNKNSLTEIQASIRPMWKNTFPEKISKIKIIDVIRGGVN